MSGDPVLFLVEQYAPDGAEPVDGLRGLGDAPGLEVRWGLELVGEGTLLLLVASVDRSAVVDAARSAGVELHHLTEARFVDLGPAVVG